MRNMQKALLCALLTPHADFTKMQDEGNTTELMAMREELKSYPWGEVWAEFCRRSGVIADEKWFDEVKAYEKEILPKRV
jgi:L-rhamnose isomerase